MKRTLAGLFCHRPNHDRGLIRLSAPTTDVTNDGKRAAGSVGKPAQKRIGDVLIEVANAIGNHLILLEKSKSTAYGINARIMTSTSASARSSDGSRACSPANSRSVRT